MHHLVLAESLSTVGCGFCGDNIRQPFLLLDDISCLRNGIWRRHGLGAVAVLWCHALVVWSSPGLHHRALLAAADPLHCHLRLLARGHLKVDQRIRRVGGYIFRHQTHCHFASRCPVDADFQRGHGHRCRVLWPLCWGIQGRKSPVRLKPRIITKHGPAPLGNRTVSRSRSQISPYGVVARARKNPRLGKPLEPVRLKLRYS